MADAIAIIGLGCEYPDASTPVELWHSVLAQRRSFRRIPRERLDLEAYWSPDRTDCDRTYCTKAALLKNFSFDRAAFGISGATFRATDLAHWLALSTAAKALNEAFADSEIVHWRETTGVFVGNSLTGEFSRASCLRVRWPFVESVLEGQLRAQGWSDSDAADFLRRCEEQYKAHFEPFSEDTLPGGLSNTIAGRICNFFDLKGGGYVLDGACASSLLAVINGCSALESRDLNVAICGGVDLSLDPFELVGFARNGALAADEMRVFDSNPTGFLPGEGCGFVVMMRLQDALAAGCNVRGVIRGWGISSDGQGGMTRPEPQGQLLALTRAYRRAGLDSSQVPYFEAHGTGTAAGDDAELTALAEAVRSPSGSPAVVSSIKAIIGHTKAAAGIAGLMKAMMALEFGTLPPTTGCITPHRILTEKPELLRAQSESSSWPQDRELLAGVSAMGFGGINTHVVLQSAGAVPRQIPASMRAACHSSQDAELFLFSADTSAALQAAVDSVVTKAASLSAAELTDLSAYLIRRTGRGQWKAALVARTAEELSREAAGLASWIGAGITNRYQYNDGIFLSSENRRLRLCYLFPGQGVSYCADDWPLYSRLVGDGALTEFAPLSADAGETEKAQVGISLQCLKQLRVLSSLAIQADAAIGHSVGELVALCWSGTIAESQLLEMVQARGRVMHHCSPSGGAMIAVMASAASVNGFLPAETVIAALNGSHIVVSGPVELIAKAEAICLEKNIHTVRLPVKYAFHSPAFAPAAKLFAAELEHHAFQKPTRTVFSTVTGNVFREDADLVRHLSEQIINPVRFESAVQQASAVVDLFLEVGSPGVLRDMVQAVSEVPVISWTPRSDTGLLTTAAVLHVSGSPVDLRRLVTTRFVRDFSPDARFDFLRNPCESLEDSQRERKACRVPQAVRPEEPVVAASIIPAGMQTGNVRQAALDKLLEIVSRKTELPKDRLQPSMNLLTDLHLSSITVAQIAIETARALGRKPLLAPTSAAGKTLEQLAATIAESAQAGEAEGPLPAIRGIDSWVGMAVVEDQPLPLTAPAIAAQVRGHWDVLGALSPNAKRIAQGVVGELSGDGVLLLYDSTTSLALLLSAVQQAHLKHCALLVVCDSLAPSLSGFARSVFLEGGASRALVVRLDFADPGAPQCILQEFGNPARFVESSYMSGQRYEPVVRLLEPGTTEASPFFTAEDCLLVLGGGKGIAAECAFELARNYGLSLALVGRSDPSADSELRNNLDRLSHAGIRFRYERGDVTSEEFCTTIPALEAEMGPITAILHAAGLNQPKSLAALTAADLEAALAPKLAPLASLQGVLGFDRLKAVIAFGSIIARMGLAGEAHYALANERLREQMEELSTRYTNCRFGCLEWSVWSGLGMGERLARVDELARQGVEPLTPEMGTRALIDFLQSESPGTSVIVTSRFPSMPTLNVSRPAIKPYRFLERTLVDYPHIELVAEADLAIQKDLYLNDHKLDGTVLFPAALGLEAMAQAATALFRKSGALTLSDIRFESPITVDAANGTTIRIVALRRDFASADIVIRSSQTAFQVDHFRATCSLQEGPRPRPHNHPVPATPLIEGDDLYGFMLFQRGRFQAVKGYLHLDSRSCTALLSPSEQQWFSQFLPQSFVLLNPAFADAAMHAIQACIPHRKLAPTAIKQIIAHSSSCKLETAVCKAVERASNQDEFVYDLDIQDQDGNPLQSWKGLTLRAVAENDATLLSTPAFIVNMLERRWREITGDDGATVSLREQGSDRVQVLEPRPRRADGKPAQSGRTAARAWSGRTLLELRSSLDSSCDLERVVTRDEATWRDLLGGPGFESALFFSQEHGEDLDLSATRAWCLAECLKKIGKPASAPVTLAACLPGRWMVMRCGGCTLCTVPIVASGNRMVAAFAARSRATRHNLPAEVARAFVSL
ncbi:MAG: beta-ketoacyl synthase N-terminal-like domain-containing protein [Candidatus Korobacteraceae bacterium]|jgi:enediyne polyketide synthase